MRSSIFFFPAVAGVLIATTCLASGTPPNMTMESAQFFQQHNSKRVKIRYGPFTVDSMNINNGMKQFVRETIQVPCTDCLITWMQAGLEYTNGTVANADTNLWLHHTVFFNQDRTSTVCPGTGTPDMFFASGNERTPVNICVNGTDQAGYYVQPTDTLGMEVELMNMSPAAQTGYVTMSFEYIPTPPSSFSQVKVLWLDIGGCNGSSDQPVKSTTQAFDYTSPKWVSDLSGRITFIGGHLHDGGTHLEVQRNGTDECDCVATYGANSEYIGGGMSMSMSMSKRAPAPATSATMTMSMPASSSTMDMSSMTMSMPATSTSSTTAPSSTASTMLMDNIHISNMSTCTNPNNGIVAPGDVWTIIAHYDPSKHDLMMNMDGTPAPIMGISLVYVADLNVTTTASAAASGSSAATSSSSGTTSNSSAAATSLGLKTEIGAMLMCVGLGLTILIGPFF